MVHLLLRAQTDCLVPNSVIVSGHRPPMPKFSGNPTQLINVAQMVAVPKQESAPFPSVNRCKHYDLCQMKPQSITLQPGRKLNNSFAETVIICTGPGTVSVQIGLGVPVA